MNIMTKLKNTDEKCDHCPNRHAVDVMCHQKRLAHCNPEKQGDDWEVEEYVLTDKSLNEEIANISFEFIDMVFEACEKPKGTRSFYISKTSKRIQKMLERVEKQTRESVIESGVCKHEKK